MDTQPQTATETAEDTDIRPTTILIAALGGEGGGVLSSWMAGVAENENWLVQTTSIPGVAQRTGATTYYIEIFPREIAEKAGQEPVMALTPNAGDIDLLVASEVIEAGRMAERGFISADRTTVICSDHRVYAIGEKSALGDGAADKAQVINALEDISKRFIHFDMMRTAQEAGTIINAVLLGAIAGSDALPFPREVYEDAIRAGGIAVESNLKGFEIGYDLAKGKRKAPAPEEGEHGEEEPDKQTALPRKLSEFRKRIEADYPATAHHIITEGIKRLLDYQGPAYVELYLDRLGGLQSFEEKEGAEKDFRLTTEAARYLALWMSFEDIIRVADLKTRSDRFERVKDEVRLEPGQVLEVYEFLKPRPEEMVSIFPPAMAKFMLRNQPFKGLLNLFYSGRQINTASVTGFLFMRSIASLRWWRPRTWRYKEEQKLIERWLDYVRMAAEKNYDLGVEVARCGRLIKGYGDTHERGEKNFDLIMGELETIAEKPEAPERIAKLREAAMADEEGEALEEELKKPA